MRWIIAFILLLFFSFCTNRGPQTFPSPFVGKTSKDLIDAKGTPQMVKKMGESDLYIYTHKEEYFGKNNGAKNEKSAPKKIYTLEYIYYVNSKDEIYKYQVWRKRIG